MMTRKDYVALAEIIKVHGMPQKAGSDTLTEYETGMTAAAVVMAVHIATHCQADNPNFNRDKFLRECGIDTERQPTNQN
jgi:hypothetical protein